MGKSQELYAKAKKLIPGGTQLLSKRPEMFLPDNWPAYYKKAKGCEVWDLDDNHFYDMSIMGIGTCVLGYADDEVNAAVKNAIDEGNMSTFNCPEEVELANKLIELHPWAQMVRFARTGGEACSIAVRIARAFTKKDKVAFCGYHGWHDWYLSSNLSDSKNLNGQLISGLDTEGVPRALKGHAHPFHYGNIEELKKIVDGADRELGVIIMEVARHKEIDVVFLNQVRAIADEIGAVLIFDEVSSGFRLNVGSVHMLHDIKPDIVILGKAMSNGYPMSAIIGKERVMQAAQHTFISSSYWTERIGPVAALKTIEQFEKKNVIKRIIDTGNYISKRLETIFSSCNLKISIEGLASVPIIVIKENDPLIIKTIFTQEMLKRGFLASNVIYVSYAHTKEIVDKYLFAVEEVMKLISENIKFGNLKEMLEGPVCHSGFNRLN